MDIWQVAATLLSALLHAGWNAVVKTRPAPTQAMTAQMVAGAIMIMPLLAWTGLPDWPAWPWILASAALNLLTVRALLAAYRLCGFGIAYPLVRAVSILLVVPFAAGLAGEVPSMVGMAGIGLVAASLLALAMGNTGAAALPKAAYAWIILAGTGTAAYVICDVQGVRSAGSPWAYCFAVSIGNAATMYVRHGDGVRICRFLVTYAPTAVPTGIAAMVSYLLVLWVWSVAPAAPTAALRDTSAIFAILIAIFWLDEPMTRARLVAVTLSAIAIPLLRFA